MKLNIEDFKLKARLEDDIDAKEIEIIKSFDSEIDSVSEDNREVTFVITTEAKDRDGDIIRANGWNFKHWMDNPVVLWGHDYSGYPIGKGVKIWTDTESKKIYSTVKFMEPDLSIEADRVYRMIKAGYLKATSVGFRSSDYEFLKDDDNGIEFKEQELLEFSVVTVPANPEALIAAGIENKDLVLEYAKQARDWATKILAEDEVKETEKPAEEELKTEDIAEMEVKEDVVVDTEPDEAPHGAGDDDLTIEDMAEKLGVDVGRLNEFVEEERADMVTIVDDPVEEPDDEMVTIDDEDIKSAVMAGIDSVLRDNSYMYAKMKKTGKIGG